MPRWNQRILAAFRSRSHRLQNRLTSTRHDPKSSPFSQTHTSRRPTTVWPPRSPWLRGFIGAYALFTAGHIFLTYFLTFGCSYGISMLPTLAADGDWVFISRYYRRGRDVKVGDIVSYKNPLRLGEDAVKRVVGMEGDFVLLYTPGKNENMIQVPEGHCWVAGDNLEWSRDSRMFGPLPLALINGKVQAKFRWQRILWPKFTFTWIEHDLQPGYEDDDLD